MKGIHGPVLVKRVNRAQREVVEGLGGLPAANIADAIGKPCTLTLDPAIKPAYQGARLVGSAVTVKEMPDCNLMSHAAIDLMKAGDVLVVDAGGHVGSAVGGFLMSRKMISKGAAGVVVDGAWRDRTEITRARFPVFCRAWQPGGPHKDQPGSVNVAVTVGGVVVHPGDVLVGDDDGVVVVPRESAAEVLEKARDIHERESETVADDRREVIEKPSPYAGEKRLKALGVTIR